MKENDSYKNLAAAIVTQAITDLDETRARLGTNPRNREALEAKNDVCQFFRSEWFDILCELNPELEKARDKALSE